MLKLKLILVFVFFANILSIDAQSFMFGTDLSYANEMEDCGMIYKEQGMSKDVYQIFADHHCNLVRLRLWHNPSWYDLLNGGKRYADFQDVRKSIARAKSKGMQVLLDFHLSDSWADPGHQVVPAAWLSVVDNLPILKDSLYNYISKTLLDLESEGLLPEMVQIGNETNRGILLSPTVDAAGWSLDWNRNSQLFKRAIQAVREVENETGKTIKIALHIAGPANAGWLMQGFWANGVTDFDVIGLSYYWQWHKPTTISDAGNVVANLRQLYPGKEVMILETGYPWTIQWKDNAPNIINELSVGYTPASALNQQKWLVALTQEMIYKGAKGVVYWEPDWQSTACWTPWVQGSSYENCTFFDFQNNLLTGGGMEFMSHPYENLSAVEALESGAYFKVWADSGQRNLRLELDGKYFNKSLEIRLLNSMGSVVFDQEFASNTTVQFPMPALPMGLYYCVLSEDGYFKAVRKVILGD